MRMSKLTPLCHPATTLITNANADRYQKEKEKEKEGGYGLIVTLIQYPVYQTLAPLPVLFEVECVEDELGLSQGVVRLLLGGKAHTLGHLCRVAARSLALDPHLQVHRCLLLAFGPIVHRLCHIKALPASLVNGDQPVKHER